MPDAAAQWLEMSAEDSETKDLKPTAETGTNIRRAGNTGYVKTSKRSFEVSPHQSDYLNRDQPFLSTPIVTTGGSDHSQQEAFPLTGDSRICENRLDPFLDDIGFHPIRQPVWPGQQMHSPRNAGTPLKNSDPLSPVSTHSAHQGGRLGRPPKLDSRQEAEAQPVGASAARALQFGSQSNRQPYSPNDMMAHSQFGRDLGGPRTSGEYMGGLTFAPEDPVLTGRSTPARRLEHDHRMFEEGPGLGAEDMAGCLPSLDSRSFLQEDELLFPSAFGNQDGFHRLSMQHSNQAEYRGDRHMSSGGYLGRGAARTRSGGMPGSAPVESMQNRPTVTGDNREAMYGQLGPLHMHRSASEGVIRAPFPGAGNRPGDGNQPGLDNASGDQRPRSGPSMQEEASFRTGAEQSRATPPARMNETPDFAMIYAFLGSMFDPVCHMIDHADVMNQMNAVDRETTNLILANCVHNLSIPEFAEHVLYHSLRQANMSARPRAPPAGNQGFGQSAHHRHSSVQH